MALENTIGMIAAGVGIVATIVYLALLVKGVRSLEDIRDTLRENRG